MQGQGHGKRCILCNYIQTVMRSENYAEDDDDNHRPLTKHDFNDLIRHSKGESRYTSNGGCRREEKSCKHWSLFTKLLSSVFFSFVISKVIVLKIGEK